MKRKTFTQKMWLTLIMLLGIPLWAWADRDVSQLQFGKQTIEVASDEVITFYDWMGTGSISSSSSNNSQSLTVFTPAQAGMSIQITFESCDVRNDGGSWPGKVYVYSGAPDADNSFVYATKTSDINASSTMPEGTVLAEMDGTYSDVSYTSASADGALSVGMLWRYAKACDGWVAKVKTVKLENMTITGAGSNYDGVGGQLAQKQNVTLANVFVTATGVMNPDPVTAIGFTMTQNEDAMDATALRLYRGEQQVDASVQADGNGYKFVLNENPADGTTTFTIKGDFLGTAQVGAKVQIDVNKVTTAGQPDGITPFTAAASVAAENPAVVIMSSTPQTVTVGETSLTFYDEGGKDGGIYSKTNGQVTFLSGVEGKKVMVDFTNNSIWHGSYYNQELRIYNGQTADADHLIKTLQQGETAVVRSSADDGSLTVVLFSDATNTINADGFVATVSLFTPQPMDFNGIATAAASEETVCCGDTNQPMLTVNVKTQNTEPVMQLTKMTFSAGDNYQLATKAALYLGTTLVGETDITAADFSITLTEPQTLTEGDNVFTLSYDISADALNNQTLSAKAISATAVVNGAEKTENISADAAVRTVKNVVVSHKDQGTVTKTLNGTMTFQTKAKSDYSTDYEAGTDERINIFVPKHEGMVAQIDFSEFKIYYYSYNVSSSAKFKIYSGQGTDGELLWEPTEADDYTAGPGRIIRSTAADGALTIAFCPNQSYSTAAGWKATVSEYLQKDMEITAIEATQATTADVSIGAAGQDLLTVNIATEGALNPLTLGALTLNLKQTTANISKISVWKEDNKLGEADAADQLTIGFEEPVTLGEGDNLFTVKVDVSAEAEENQTIDAKLVSALIGTNDTDATTGDPDGARTLKNMLLMTEGDHGTLQLAMGKSFMIYDDGGADGDGADGVNATLTLAPTGDADCIRLTDLGISFAYTAHLYIYEGSKVDDDKLITDLTGSSAKFGTIVADADNSDGCLTIKYVGAGSYTKPNFAIKAEGYKKTTLHIASVSAEDISGNGVLKGQTDVKMLKVAVVAEGDLDGIDITSFNVSSSNSDAIAAQHIYATGTLATFSVNEEVTDLYTISEPGTYYFWLTCDVKTDAEKDLTADMTLQSITANGETIDANEPLTATITVMEGMKGDILVGQGETFATIQDAINEIGAIGMEGPVTLKIKAGEYNEKVRIPYIKGMGSVNTLTLESQSGERDVKIYHDNYTTSGYSDDQHKKDYGVVTLYEASYVTLHNLEICTADKAYKAVVMVKDESRHATIDNCYLHAPVCTASSGEDVCLVGHTIIDEENRNNDYLTVSNCLLEGGKMGVNMGGTSYVSLPKEVGGVIEGNTFRNNGQKAIYVMDELGVKIRNNTIIIEADAETKTSVGILDMQLRDEYDVPTEITGNIFNVAPKTYCAVMNLRQMEGAPGTKVVIANNVINLASLSASYSAFKFNSNKVKYVNVANNTIRMTGTTGGAAFWVSSTLADGYGNINVVNNIIQNETSGYAVNLYNDGNLGTDKINFQNNVIYTSGETFYRASTGTTGDFASFTEKTGATGCVNKQVSFLSESVLEPADNLDGDLLTALPLAYVTTDVAGKQRPAESITIGAYEYDANAGAAPVMAEGYPKVNAHLDGTATFAVRTDIAATVFYIVQPADATAPTAEQLMQSDSKQDVIADTETAISVSELQDEAQYVAYFLPVSLRGVQGEVCQTETFTMDVTPPAFKAPIAEVYINNSDSEERVAPGDEVTLMALVAVDERTAPYTLTWMDQQHNVILSETYESADDIDDIFTTTAEPTECTDYIFTATDAQGLSTTATVRAIVEGDLQVATFETNYADPEDGFWMGNFEKGIEGSTFVSGSFSFHNYACDTWNGQPTTPYWGDFAYSQSTSKLFTGDYITEQFNNAVGTGADGSRTFLVANPQGGTINVLNDEGGDVVPGFFLTNDAWNVDAYINGDGMSTIDGTAAGESTGNVGFQTGDWCKLTITADNGNTKEVYLADYTDNDADEHYFLDTWQWIDLADLGTVKSLSFFVSSSRRNAWGTTTPQYFCMDNLGAARPEVEKRCTLAPGKNTVNLSAYFEKQDSLGTVRYEFADEPDATLPAMTIDNGTLTVSTDQAEFAGTVVLKATQRGKVQYVRLQLSRQNSLPTAIEAISSDETISSRHSLDGKTLTNGSRQKGVQILRRSDGTVIKVARK